MKFWHYLIVFVAALGIFFLAGSFQTVPGYMDAAYYYLGGVELASGGGFNLNFLWNFLDHPASLPHPSHSYWMPMASMIAAAGIKLIGQVEFSAAKIGFLLIAAAIPSLTMALAYQVDHNPRSAFLAGGAALFGGFYLPYFTTTDTFGISMLLGAVFFLILGRFIQNQKLSWALGLGLVAGFFYLTRADGLIWLLVSLFALSEVVFEADPQAKIGRYFALLIFGFLSIAGFWMARNIQVFGTPLSPGGGAALWLTDYNETFIFPADQLNFAHWWQSGIAAILQARLWALGVNLQRTLAEQGSIVLLPFMVAGIWFLRKDTRIKVGLLAWGLTFGLMTVVFPFAGARGGWFHSGAALQPLWWAIFPVGLNQFVDWGVKKRGWHKNQASAVFGWGIVVVAALISLMAYSQRVIGAELDQPVWQKTADHYRAIETEIRNAGAYAGDVVMVKNPPDYYFVSERKAVVIPDGDIFTLAKAVDRFDARYLILEAEHTRGLDKIYNDPERLPQWMEYIATIDGSHLFLLKCSVCRVVQ